MNTLKPLLIIAIISGVGYGVWNRLNRKPDVPPPGVAEGWDTAPKIDTGTDWNNGPPPGPATSGSTAPPAGMPAPIGSSTASSDAPPAGSAAADPTGYAPPAGQPGAATDPIAGDTGAGSYSTDLGQSPPNASPPADASASQAPGGGPQFLATFESARHELEAGHLAEGLLQLSAWYDNPQLTPTEHQLLNQVLDQVAGTVIYSTKDLLGPPYEVQPGDRLEDIGQRYNVPWQLLAKINGIDDPQSLRPGERLKIVRGPFDAVISLDKKQLTLMLNGAYAGRFAIGLGHDNPPREGEYTVVDKMVNPPYRRTDRSIEGGDPANPLGTRWMGLGAGGFGIHGTNDPAVLGQPDQAGCIGMGKDVDDVYDILSIGSRVTIRR